MASVIEKFKNYLFSPQLFKKFDELYKTEEPYNPKLLEAVGNNGLSLISYIISLSKYCGPIAAVVLYRKGYCVWENVYFITKALQYGVLMSVTCYAARALGRSLNPEYHQFYSTLETARQNVSKREVKNKLMQYDFAFADWPVEYIDRSPGKQGGHAINESQENFSVRIISDVAKWVHTAVFSPLSLATHSANYVAIKMVYPGSSKILQNLALHSALADGRQKLMMDFHADRCKIRSRDQNDIDVILVDRRNDKNCPNGRTLVVCCEGNCGFYEIGIMMTPIEAKYSVLGWNHPGFGGSTGLPFPSQEKNAIEAVMNFAIDHLGFKEEEIILYGWSIGGFTSSWAALNYPRIKGLIIDASFDDILPLALAQMPPLIHGLVGSIIRNHINLCVWRNVIQYPGPVTFVRRSDDEMITTVKGDVSTNRGNDLVFKVFEYRYPRLTEGDPRAALKRWLSSTTLEQKMMRDRYFVDVMKCSSILTSYVEEYGAGYPMEVGVGLSDDDKISLVIYLAENYMKEYGSTHCTPLPVSMFRLPWSPTLSKSSNQSAYNSTNKL